MTSAGRAAEPGWLGSCGTQQNSLAPLLGVDAGSASGPDAGFATHFAGPATPASGRTVKLRGCSLFALQASQGDTRVAVDITPALGSLACGNAAGQVTRFEARLGDEVRAADCGNSAVFRNVPADSFLEFQVVAFAASSSSDGGTDQPEASWATTCYQEVATGQQLVARCDPLVALE
jgi:hypothetical protein